MQIPRLMVFQEYPWNGDGYLAAEVLRLKEAHGLKIACETGTCLGSTTRWLAEHFNLVNTCDVNANWMDIAMRRTSTWAGKICMSLTPSTSALKSCHAEGLYFLDAHWGDHCPLLEELEIIASKMFKPCIIIHDFKVPGTDFGFDKMPDGRPFCFELVRPYLNDIYGEGKWKHNYPTQVEGAKRGWISVEPIRE